MELSGRREEIWIRAEAAQLLELWALAQPPGRVLGAEVMGERVREYFRVELEKGVGALAKDSSVLGEVLIEMMELVEGTDEISGWRPPGLWEALLRIGERL